MNLVLMIEPKPQSRPRFARRGKYTTAYEDKDMKAWRNECSSLIAEYFLLYPVDDEKAYSMDMTFYIYPPKYILDKKKYQQALADETLPVPKRPDTDNYIKAVMDSWSGMVFKDDGQVTDLSGRKRYSLNPRIEVKIEVMEWNSK